MGYTGEVEYEVVRDPWCEKAGMILHRRVRLVKSAEDGRFMNDLEHNGDHRVAVQFVRDGKLWQREYFIIPRPQLANGSKVLHLKVPGSTSICEFQDSETIRRLAPLV